MNWADTMKNNAEFTSNELISSDAAVRSRDASTSWDPHEVWLTRVKVPRDRAALELAENAPDALIL